MKSLFDRISEIPSNQWNYYYNPSISLDNPILKNSNQGEFIKNYFKRGGKGGIFKEYFTIKNSLLHRSKHTVSIFFIGILIYHNSIIKQKMCGGRNLNRIDFPFLWFLTCLFHDFGYDYEKNSRKYSSKIKDIDSLRRYFEVEHYLLDKNPNNIPKDLYKNISNYFLYKLTERKEIDHGIVAGMYLYDMLVKNRLFRRNGNDNVFYWGDDLDDEYALAGATIATHNIWFAGSNMKKIYEGYNLDCLINHMPISSEEAPLLFLLGLVDTIDPIKLYGAKGYSNLKILKNILFDCSKDEIKLSVASGSKLNINDLEKKCSSLESWLQVKIYSKNTQIKIKLDS